MNAMPLTTALTTIQSQHGLDFTDGISRSCMSLVSKHLRMACDQPDNISAREGMMLAAVDGNDVSLLQPDKDMKNGSKIE